MPQISGVCRHFLRLLTCSRCCLMSSLTNRSATGAVKTKVQNVNSVYSGKNQLQGGKPLGRNGGLTAIGKASGVVRRMPPPPTLPSLRAESQGQDPDIAIKPSLSSVVAASAATGVDMRPAWAKPPTTAAPPTETTPVAGYPSLATAAAAANEETRASRTWRSSGSMSEEPMQELPARFYDGGNGPVRPYQPARFQGSSDARATQPGATYGAAPAAVPPRQTERWSTSEATREPIPEEPPKIEQAARAEHSYDYTKRNGGAADNQEEDRSSGRALSPQPPSQPAENVWEKRKEERASAERERASQLRQARTLEAAMAQHFPSVAEAATMRVEKESTRKPADADFARMALRARRGPVVNDVRALQEDGAAAPPPRPRMQPMQQQQQQRRRPDEEYGGGGGGEYGGYERRREYDDRRQYDGPQRGYERRDHAYRSDYGRQDYGRPEEDRRAEEYERDERQERSERAEGGEEHDEEERVSGGANNNGVRREYQPRGGRGGGGQQRGQRGNGYGQSRGGGRGGQRNNYERRREGVQQQQPQHPSDKRSWRRSSPVEGETTERTPEGQKEVRNEEADGAPRRRFNNNGSHSQYQHQQPRVTMTRGVRGGRGTNARGSARGDGHASTAAHQRRPQQPRDEQQDGGDVVTHEKRHTAASASARPTRGLYAPRGARRGAHEGRTASDVNSEGSGAAADAATGGEETVQLQQPPSSQQRLKSPVASSEGHEEWETASESSQKGERKSREPASLPAAPAAAARSNGAHAQQSQPKNGLQPASRTYTTTHAKREGGTKRGERPERQASRKASTGKRAQRDESEESVDRLAGLDLHDERRVVIVDDHPASTHITGAEHADFEEVLSKKQKRARAEEEKARAEAEERRLQRERERAERVQAKREKRMQAKTEREEAQRAAKAEAAAKKKAEKEDKAMTTVWNSAQPEARAALESSEAAAAAAAAGGASVDAAAAASDVLPSPIARPRATAAAAAAATKKPAVDFVGGARGGDEKAVKVTQAPSETGSAVTTDDQRRLTENVNLCKELWSSGEVACSAAAAAASGSAHHSPNTAAVAAREAAAATGVLPTNVAKVKPQPHASVAVSVAEVGDATGASCAPRPPSECNR
ncbi:hypothetical protein PMAYCL1PPCAC_04235 [Pristionchus mayeri]|uniref:BAT2 N-terminal domain-containing protein n=1 Tax=Pristionchus mayeri TaxID=1317129 RepID=A0AAN5C7V8_9BILA|nr:hypothetical protein PMAYCL1PPCAC_04235 [Pristionchus mayeri]